MLIGQLSRESGASERQIRYYERVGLLASSRRANGYRDFPDGAPEIVARIRALLDGGPPTSTIRRVLPCVLDDGVVQPCPGVLPALRTQLARLDDRATTLARTRATLAAAIAKAEAVDGD